MSEHLTRKPSALARRELARKSYATLLGMTRVTPEGTAYSLTDHTANYLRDQAGVALGVYLGDLLAETVSTSSRTTADQLGAILRDTLRRLESEAYADLTE